MSVSTSFSELDLIRPSGARFGEVVNIELYVANGESEDFIGSHKRKSIHCQPRVNAYWNFVGLRSELIQWFSREGVQRPLRSWMMKQLNLCVRVIHLRELEAAYEAKYDSVQYYRAYIYPALYNVRADQMPAFKGFSMHTSAVYSATEVETYPQGTGLELCVVENENYRVLR